MASTEFKTIQLSNGEFTEVSPEDYDDLIQYKWSKLNGYATTKINEKRIYMHTYLLGKSKENSKNKIDHIDRDKLNNTRENLREASDSQNSQNRDKREGTTSKYIGVSWHPEAGKFVCWCARTYLGSFDKENEIEAAKKYDTYAYIKFGKHASTNNLVKYEDVKDIDITTLLSPRPKRELPDNIYKKRDAFEAIIEYKENKFRSYQPSQENFFFPAPTSIARTPCFT